VPDVLYIHPAKHDVNAGFRDLGFYARRVKGCQASTGGLARVQAFLQRHQRGPGLQAGSTQSPRCARRHFGFTFRGRDFALLPRGRLCHSGRCRGAPAEPGQARMLQRQRTPILKSQPDLPGEDDRTFRQTLRVTGRIRHSYPPNLLNMVNMAHTLARCSPMSRRPHRIAELYGLLQVPRADRAHPSWRRTLEGAPFCVSQRSFTTEDGPPVERLLR
jgi:hypothetical protein